MGSVTKCSLSVIILSLLVLKRSKEAGQWPFMLEQSLCFEPGWDCWLTHRPGSVLSSATQDPPHCVGLASPGSPDHIGCSRCSAQFQFLPQLTLPIVGTVPSVLTRAFSSLIQLPVPNMASVLQENCIHLGASEQKEQRVTTVSWSEYGMKGTEEIWDSTFWHPQYLQKQVFSSDHFNTVFCQLRTQVLYRQKLLPKPDFLNQSNGCKTPFLATFARLLFNS